MTDFVTRLRQCRKEKRLTQAQFADLAGVGLGAQNRYEQGATEPSASYFAHLAQADVDVTWVLTGRRSGQLLSAQQSDWLATFSVLSAGDRDAILRLAASLAGQPLPARSDLPSPRALAAAFEAFLSVTPLDDPAEFAQELATSLPSLLEAAQDEIPLPASETADAPPARPAVDDADRQTGRRAQRN